MNNVAIQLTNFSGISLSANAEKLYKFLIESNGAHESKCIDYVFDKPTFPQDNNRDARIAFWQFEADCYGGKLTRAVHKIESGKYEFMDFEQNISVNYASQLSAAYRELNKNGLAKEKNNGYNSYTFYPIKQGNI